MKTKEFINNLFAVTEFNCFKGGLKEKQVPCIFTKT